MYLAQLSLSIISCIASQKWRTKILPFVLFITLVPTTVLTPITWQFLIALKNKLQYLKARRMSFHVIRYNYGFI